MTDEPREYSRDEITAMFLEGIASMVQYWDAETRAATSHEKLTGLAHSFCAMLSGCALGLPKFKIVTDPHPEDKEYHQENEEDWFPEADDAEDICFALNEIIYSFYDPEYIDKAENRKPNAMSMMVRKLYPVVHTNLFFGDDVKQMTLSKIGRDDFLNSEVMNASTRNSLRMNVYTLATETMQPNQE